MYVRRTAMPERFPPNYHGNLSEEDKRKGQPFEHNRAEISRTSYNIHKYKVKKNSYCTKRGNTYSKHEKHIEKPSLFENATGDELLLLGLLVFLYVGCEHTKDNLILMGALVYLLFAVK